MHGTRLAKGVWYLPSGPNETWMFQMSPHGGFAPHIHVLYREVPVILNITACPEGRYCAPLAGHGANHSSQWQSYSEFNTLVIRQIARTNTATMRFSYQLNDMQSQSKVLSADTFVSEGYQRIE